jgi:xanthine dehydrogenase YagT iron-sulfur-binding subunit
MDGYVSPSPDPPPRGQSPTMPLAPGATAPTFWIRDRDGVEHALEEFRGQPVILAFYPRGWDLDGEDQAEVYNRLAARIPGADANLIGLSQDGLWRELEFPRGQVRVPLLALNDEALARRFGVAQGPAVFLIDGDGVIRWRHAGPAGEEPTSDEVLRAVAAVSSPRATSGTAARELSRREFVATLLAAAVAVALRQRVARAESVMAPTVVSEPPDVSAPSAVDVTLRVNGKPTRLTLDSRTTLLDALREHIGLTGTKKGCDHGQCGACTVHVDARRVLSCLTLAAMAQGKEITTVEGLAQGDRLHPMQQAFIDHDGFQCGYCTSGQIMSAVALLREPCGPSDDEVRECMSGNICRCGAYPNIVAAIQEVRQTMASSGTRDH